MKNLRPKGPRGVMLLGFGITGMTLGLSYFIHGGGARDSLEWLTNLIPMQVFAVCWFIVGLWLAVAAFTYQHKLALAAHSGLCVLWGTAYGVAAVIKMIHGEEIDAFFIVPLFWGLAVACGAAVRMSNPVQNNTQAPTPVSKLRRSLKNG